MSKKDYFRILNRGLTDKRDPLKRTTGQSVSVDVPDDVDNAKYWTVKSLAQLWDVSESTVRREIERGELYCLKIGGSVRITDRQRKMYEMMRTPTACRSP